MDINEIVQNLISGGYSLAAALAVLAIMLKRGIINPGADPQSAAA